MNSKHCLKLCEAQPDPEASVQRGQMTQIHNESREMRQRGVRLCPLLIQRKQGEELVETGFSVTELHGCQHRLGKAEAILWPTVAAARADASSLSSQHLHLADNLSEKK